MSAGSVCMTKSFSTPGTPYSYAPRYTTGCFPPKLSKGGGDGMLHSSVVESQGFSGAFAPFFKLQKRLIRKMICTAAVMYAACVMNLCTGIKAFMKSKLVKSAYRRGLPERPRKCIGVKIAYT